MIQWLSANIGTLIAGALLIAVVCAAAASVIKDKKKGRSTCGSNCAHCAMAGSCHRKAV